MREDILKAAIQKLGKKDFFRAELYRVLSAKFDEADVEEICQYLEEKNLLNDNRLISNYVHQNNGPKAVSMERLRGKLRAIGATEVDLSSGISEEINPAQLLSAKKYPKNADSMLDLSKLKARAFRFLIQKGFEEDLASATVDKYFQVEEP